MNDNRKNNDSYNVQDNEGDDDDSYNNNQNIFKKF